MGKTREENRAFHCAEERRGIITHNTLVICKKMDYTKQSETLCYLHLSSIFVISLACHSGTIVISDNNRSTSTITWRYWWMYWWCHFFSMLNISCLYCVLCSNTVLSRLTLLSLSTWGCVPIQIRAKRSVLKEPGWFNSKRYYYGTTATMHKEFTVQSGMFIAGGGATVAVAIVISG